MMVREVAAVVAAAASNRGIGYQGQLPWSLGDDLKHFQRVTTTPPPSSPGLINAVLMGRKTWESLPRAFRPLPDRINVVLTSRHQATVTGHQQQQQEDDGTVSGSTTSSSSTCPFPADVMVASSLSEAMELLHHRQLDRADVAHIFVIGGEQLYRSALMEGLISRVIYTEVEVPKHVADKCDTFFPVLSSQDWICRPYDHQEEIGVAVGQSTPSTSAIDGDDDNNNNKENFFAGHSDQKQVLKSTTSNDAARSALDRVDSKSGLTYRIYEYIKKGSPCPQQQQHAEEQTKPDPKTNQLHAATAAKSDTARTSFVVEDDDGSVVVVNQEEQQYLDLCRHIIQEGVSRGDRTGTGTLSLFGTQMRFNLRNGTLPLLTTKRVFWRGVAEELLWFISGSTNANDLAAKDIHIWDDNGSREFLDGRGLVNREVGDLGPVYGFQWRHFGAPYLDMHTNYDGQGIDQLTDCIHKIIHQPEDRRIVMSAWNPADLRLMALPPCHMFCQFYVDTEKNELSCQMYQRSADMGLGVPFNIASYALLTHLVAHVTGRTPGDFVHTIGDAHVYLNHVEALQEQLQRKPRPFPKLRINPLKTNIDDFVLSDLELIGYHPHKPIKMKMAV